MQQAGRWTTEVYPGGNFERFYRKLNEIDQAIVTAAIEHILLCLVTY